MIFAININIMKINNDKNVKVFGLIAFNIIFKTSLSVEKTKKHYLIFKIAISILKSYFLFIAFFNLYFIVNSYKINLCKAFSLT